MNKSKNDNNRITLIVMFFIAVLFFYCLMKLAGVQSFWVDELYEVGFIRESYTLMDTIKVYLTLADIAPPTFSLVAFFWYRLVPHTEWWLRMLPALATTLGLFVLGLTGRKYRGNAFGILCMAFGIASSTLITGVGLEFRQYGFLFLAISLTLFCYMNRLEELGNESWKSVIIYGIVMALIPYTHYLAVIICIALFLGDVFLFFNKKIRGKFIISYVLGALLFIPWLVSVLLNTNTERLATAFDGPTWKDIVDKFLYLTGYEEILEILFLVSIIVIIYKSLIKMRNKTFTFEKDYVVLLNVGVILFVMSVLYIVSVSIMKGSSIFVNRYVLCLLPFVFFTLAYGSEMIITVLQKLLAEEYRKCVESVIAIMIICILGMHAVTDAQTQVQTIRDPYREAAALLQQHEDIYDEDTVILFHYSNAYFTGWREMYWVDIEDMDKINFHDTREEDLYEQFKAAEYKKVYTLNLHVAFDNEDIEEYLNENYDIVSIDENSIVTEWQMKE